MSSDDKSSVKSSNLDDLIDNLISDEDLERYIAEQNDGLTREEREKIKRENRINAINQWCAENPGRDPARAKDKTIKQLALDEEAEVRIEEFRKNNPEEMAEIERRNENKSKYFDDRETYKAQLPRDYLHKDSYETRLKKAEALNGCSFKTRTFKSKRFTDQYEAELESPDSGSTLEGHWVESDGKQLAISWFGGWSNLFTALSFLLMVAAVMFFFVDLVVIGFVWGDYRWVPFAIYAPMFIVGFYMLKHRAILAHRDNFYFNRHTGLVKTPHTLFRKPFYLPYEDIVCYGANQRNVGSARGGSRVFVSLMVPLKYPKHYRFTKPTFYVGGSNRDWDSLAYATAMTFMDTSIPLGTHLYQSIEHYFKIDKDITEKHGFPEELKPYLDPVDCQVNREAVW
ncbi:dolichyl-diphosphooligosaccharide--protein glycosyltransferase subunit 2 [Pseudoalteromonas lipolytica]|uniref:dolichyl-diphosphooligosaccharide--protein glycosyltransferase subunit 2 n=1 Tax=Pseudoalteromonas lipolytica TaxID=570156 RepID=UPI000AC54D6C|nr:dolichyl-diphosphooligosaccharide--protein glycosyltransferase subunit 2 [Pseudoalteromonas lipolytica]